MSDNKLPNGIDRVVGQHLLRLAKQLGTLVVAWRIVDLVVQRVELGIVIAPVVAGIGVVAEVERLHVQDDREVEILLDDPEAAASLTHLQVEIIIDA